jgi:hypothetical protein
MKKRDLHLKRNDESNSSMASRGRDLTKKKTFIVRFERLFAFRIYVLYVQYFIFCTHCFSMTSMVTAQ